MSKLEVDFLAAVGDLIEPEWPSFEDDFIRNAVGHSDVIARWALKTAITANLAGVIKRPIPGELSNNVRLGNLPTRFFVRLGHIRKRDFKLVTNRGFQFIENDKLKWRGAASQKSLDVVFQLNHLAIRAINAPGAELGFDAPDGVLPIPAFPAPKDFKFNNYSFDSFESFEQRLRARIPTQTGV